MKNKSSNLFVLFIDWGTTNFRAYKFNLIKNKVENKIENNKGILNINNTKQYVSIILKVLKKFGLSKKTYILMAGMVGSKKGLYEVPYLEIPINLKNISTKIILKKILNINLRIIPGLVFKENNFFDVLRGEETLVIGAINKLNIKKKCYICCPGTHSKWITIKKNKFIKFSSFMSGELYSVISKWTILSQSLPKISKNSKSFSKKYFIKGLNLIKKNYPLLSTLFKIRTMDLFNQTNAVERDSFLSALLIGLEINHISKNKDLKRSSVILISSGPLTKLYSISLNYYKIKFDLVYAEECFISGITNIYESDNKKFLR